MLSKDEGNATDRVAFVSGYALYALDLWEEDHLVLLNGEAFDWCW